MTKELNKPIFIISLDVESIWGYAAYPSHKDIDLLKRDDTIGRGCIDILLNLFQKHNIPATWAVVGHLFLDHCECEDGIPHKDTFSSVLMIDAFHYVDARALLAKEFERVLSKEGMLLLLHLHNALVENVAAGKPLSTSTWKGLFDLKVKALPEKTIVEDFILRDRLDLSKKYSKEELNLSDAISIIGGADLDCFDGIWKDVFKIKGNLVINPIYKMKEEGEKILLEREFPSEFFRKEFPLTEKYLPERCEIDKRFVNGRSVRVSGSDEIEIEDLMRKFVIINVPEKYV